MTFHSKLGHGIAAASLTVALAVTGVIMAPAAFAAPDNETEHGPLIFGAQYGWDDDWSVPNPVLTSAPQVYADVTLAPQYTVPAPTFTGPIMLADDASCFDATTEALTIQPCNGSQAQMFLAEGSPTSNWVSYRSVKHPSLTIDAGQNWPNAGYGLSGFSVQWDRRAMNPGPLNPAADADLTFTLPSNTSFKDTAPITLGGTGEPGETVTLTVGGTTIGTTTVNTDGTWSHAWTVTTPRPKGLTTVTATSNGQTATKDLNIEQNLTFTKPNEPATNTTETNTFLLSDAVTLGGEGEPGKVVTLTAYGAEIGTTTVKSDGTWEYVWSVTTPRPSGPVAVVATSNGQTATNALCFVLVKPVFPVIDPLVAGGAGMMLIAGLAIYAGRRRKALATA